MKTFPDTWQSMPREKKQQWAELASTTFGCMNVTATDIRKERRMPGKHWRDAVARAYIEMGETRSGKLHKVEASLFPSIAKAS